MTSLPVVAGAVPFVIALALVACGSSREGSDVGSRARRAKRDAGTKAAPPTVLDPGFRYACSPDAEVGCTGVFAPRGPSTPPSTLALLSQGRDSLALRLDSLRRAKRSIRIVRKASSGFRRRTAPLIRPRRANERSSIGAMRATRSFALAKPA